MQQFYLEITVWTTPLWQSKHLWRKCRHFLSTTKNCTLYWLSKVEISLRSATVSFSSPCRSFTRCASRLVTSSHSWPKVLHRVSARPHSDSSLSQLVTGNMFILVNIVMVWSVARNCDKLEWKLEFMNTVAMHSKISNKVILIPTYAALVVRWCSAQCWSVKVRHCCRKPPTCTRAVSPTDWKQTIKRKCCQFYVNSR